VSSRPRARLVLLTIASVGLFLRPFSAQTRTPAAPTASSLTEAQPAIDRDLLEISIPQLHRLYATHKYTVT